MDDFMIGDSEYNVEEESYYIESEEGINLKNDKKPSPASSPIKISVANLGNSKFEKIGKDKKNIAPIKIVADNESK